MKKSIGGKPCLFISLAVLLVALVAVPAGAKNNDRKLYGDYAANFSLNCATCGLNFTATGPYTFAPACLPAGTVSTKYTWNAQGTYAFDGQGNFEFSGRYLAVLSDKLLGVIPVVLPQKLRCTDGTYSVNDDLTFDAGFEECTVYGDESELVKVHRIFNVNLKGQILERLGRPILLLTDTLNPVPPPVANIEIVTDELSTEDPKPETFRICGMTGTAIPIKGKRTKKNK